MTFSVANSGANASQRRKVMVVAEPTRESAAALHYVLSHVIFENDILYLLHVENPTFWMNRISYFMKQASMSTHTNAAGESGGSNDGVGGGCIGGNIDFLEHMKNACELVQPKLKVKALKIESEARDKGYVIISQTKMLEIDLLVVGKRQSLANAILRQRKNGLMIRGDTAEYLLEHSECTCVAVQRKGQTGGYLLHTKTHRNFWLLA
ncbi:uncharacterized protein [Rutidosis leptorrhynchoides]|uniref:uncharacterized protein n=1 Tax=Rutidosis leptorrhynchoides TaxID=125765 RepID=UPI003A994060